MNTSKHTAVKHAEQKDVKSKTGMKNLKKKATFKKQTVEKNIKNEDRKRKREDGEQSEVVPPKKMTKREKKDVINKKKAARNANWDTIANARMKWEEFNKFNITIKNKKNQKDKEPKRQKLLDELSNLLHGKLYDVAIRHDTSRIIQSVLKWGNEKQLMKIFQELKPKLKELSENIYGHKLVMKMLKYLPTRLKENSLKVRDELFTILFKGQLKNMLTKRFPAQVVDYAYLSIWSNKERNTYLREFYGSEFWFQGDETIDAVTSLKEVLTKHPNKTQVVTNSLGQVISKIVDKGLIDLELSQKLLVDFFETADRVSIQNTIFDLAENDAIPFILHTHNGALISIYCIAYGTPKDKKRIITSLSNTEGESLVVKACKTYCGSIVIRYLLQSVDDTVRTNKTLLREIKKYLLDIMNDTHGSKVILHLLVPDNKTYFSKEEISMVNPELRAIVLKSKEKKTGEENTTENEEKMEQDTEEDTKNTLVVTKKTPEKIRKEILHYLAPSLIETITNNMETLIAHNIGSKIVLETILNTDLPKDALYTKLIEIFINNREKAITLLKQQTASRTLSKIILSEQIHTLGNLFVERLQGDKLKQFILEMHGGYIVAALVKVTNIKSQVEPMMGEVRQSDTAGCKFLTGVMDGTFLKN